MLAILELCNKLWGKVAPCLLLHLWLSRNVTWGLVGGSPGTQRTVVREPLCCRCIYIRQSSSSLRSPQSLSASHCQIVNTHFPLVHWNSFGSHCSGFTVQHRTWPITMTTHEYNQPISHAKQQLHTKLQIIEKQTRLKHVKERFLHQRLLTPRQSPARSRLSEW